MKSLTKSLKLFEYVAGQNGAPVTPGMASAHLGFDPATCTRILKSLTERGYLEKISRNTGYILGPTIYSLALRNSIYRDLNNAAALPIQKLSVSLGIQVNLSIRHSHGRLMMAHHCPKAGWHPWPQTWFENNEFYNATNRLLLTTCDSKTIDEVYSKHDEWGEFWTEGAKSKEALIAEIEKFKVDAYTCFQSGDNWVSGFLIEAQGFPTTAIGYGIDINDDLEAAKKQSFETILEIKKNLMPSQNVF